MLLMTGCGKEDAGGAAGGVGGSGGGSGAVPCRGGRSPAGAFHSQDLDAHAGGVEDRCIPLQSTAVSTRKARKH